MKIGRTWYETMCLVRTITITVFCFLFLYFWAHFNSPASGQAVIEGVISSPPGTCLPFLQRREFSIPTARQVSSNVVNLRSRAFRESIWAQQNVPTNFGRECTRGPRTHAFVAGTGITCYTFYHSLAAL